jgi:hypothetical protein
MSQSDEPSEVDVPLDEEILQSDIDEDLAGEIVPDEEDDDEGEARSESVDERLAQEEPDLPPDAL